VEIMGILAGLFMFIICITAYTLGLKHGKQLSNKEIPKINLNPIQSITEVVEGYREKKKVEEAEEELEDIMSASREGMLKSVKGVR
jgi:hypothetical protein